MARKKTCTLKLVQRTDSPYWHVKGTYNGKRVRSTTGKTTKGEAQVELSRIIAELDERDKNGNVKVATFNEIALVHLSIITKKTADKDYEYTAKLKKFIGNMKMNDIKMRPKEYEPVHILNKYIASRAESRANVSITTVNKELSFLNTMGNKAVKEYGLLDYWTPIRLLDKDEAEMYGLNMPVSKLSLTKDMEVRMLDYLPPHLGDMMLFSMHTGQRDSVVCNLKWEWLTQEDGISLFKIPKRYMKSEAHMDEDAYVILNDIAKNIVDRYVGNGSEYVFIDEHGHKVTNINGSDYRSARMRVAEFCPDIMKTDVHSFKRTFVTRLTELDVDPIWVARLANHSVGGVTERYVKMTRGNRQTMHNHLQKLVDQRPALRLHSGTDNQRLTGPEKRSSSGTQLARKRAVNA